MSGYSTPCTGELQFWSVMRSQMMEQTKQLRRIADALEMANHEKGLPVSGTFADECLGGSASRVFVRRDADTNNSSEVGG